MTSIECGSCHMVFGVSAEFYRQCRQDGRAFRCPNTSCKWPRQAFTSTDNQKLEKKVAALEGKLSSAESRYYSAMHRAAHQERRAASYKGHFRRVRNKLR